MRKQPLAAIAAFTGVMALCAAVAGPAQAAPDAAYGAQIISTGGGLVVDSGAFTGPGAYVLQDGGSRVAIGGAPGPFVDVQLNTDGALPVYGSGELTYYFEILGANVDDIQVVVETTFGLAMQGDVSLVQAGACIGASCALSSQTYSNFNFDPFTTYNSFNLNSNFLMSVKLFANASGGVSDGAAAAHAYATSKVYISEDYLAEHPELDGVLSVRFSQGVGNTPVVGGYETTVPEPATWALMLAGFALTGAALRRRRVPA